MWITQRKNRYLAFLAGLTVLVALHYGIKSLQGPMELGITAWVFAFIVLSVVFDFRDKKSVGRKKLRRYFIYIGWNITLRNEPAATILLFILKPICSWSIGLFFFLILGAYFLLWVSDEMEKF